MGPGIFPNTRPNRGCKWTRAEFKVSGIQLNNNIYVTIYNDTWAFISASNPTIYIWCDHTKNPNNPIEAIAYTIEISPNTGFLEYVDTTCEIIPNPGIIKIYTSGCLLYIYILYIYNLDYIFIK